MARCPRQRERQAHIPRGQRTRVPRAGVCVGGGVCAGIQAWSRSVMGDGQEVMWGPTSHEEGFCFHSVSIVKTLMSCKHHPM